MNTYWPTIRDSISAWKDLIISSNFLETYSTHLIYCSFLLILFIFNPLRPKSKIDLFLKTYKDCFTHEISLKKNFTRKTKFNYFCVSLIDILLLVGFLLSLTDIPSSKALDYVITGRSPEEEFLGLQPDSAGGYINFAKKTGILVYLMLQESKINLYFKLAIVLLGFRFLLKRWKGTFESNYKVMLRQIQSDKHAFVDKFFELVGSQFAESLERYILKKNKIKSKEWEEMKERNSKLEGEVSQAKASVAGLSGELEVYREFAESMIDFQWCESCFNGEEFEAVKGTVGAYMERVERDDEKEGIMREVVKRLLEKRDGHDDCKGRNNGSKKYLSQSSILATGNTKKIEDEVKNTEKIKEKIEIDKKTNQKTEISKNNHQKENEKSDNKKNLERAKSEEKKPKKIEKEKSRWDLMRQNISQIREKKGVCHENCLIMFLLKCDQIGKLMHAKLANL